MSGIVVEHNPAWAAAFAAEAQVLTRTLSPLAVTLHHMGSTAVAGLAAKPIIDMLCIVPALDALDAAAQRLTVLGYEGLGAYGIEGRRYFRKNNAEGVRTHHLHAYGAGSPHIARHLAFRDYLRAHPDRAAAYGALKTTLSTRSPASYQDDKGSFVAALEAEALVWVSRLDKNA